MGNLVSHGEGDTHSGPQLPLKSKHLRREQFKQETPMAPVTDHDGSHRLESLSLSLRKMSIGGHSNPVRTRFPYAIAMPHPQRRSRSAAVTYWRAKVWIFFFCPGMVQPGSAPRRWHHDPW